MKMTILIAAIAISGLWSAPVDAQPRTNYTSSTAASRKVPLSLQNKLNEQFKEELTSAYYYFAVSNYFEEQGLEGCMKWFEKQAKEEMDHAMKVYTFMQRRDIPIAFPSLEGPRVNFSSPFEAFKQGLEKEEVLSGKIREIYSTAQKMDEYEIATFLNFFLEEQVEEEDLFRTIVKKFDLVPNGDGVAILIIDQQLGQR